MKHKHKLIAIFTLSSFGVVSCNGGGSGAAQTSKNIPSTNQFVLETTKKEPKVFGLGLATMFTSLGVNIIGNVFDGFGSKASTQPWQGIKGGTQLLLNLIGSGSSIADLFLNNQGPSQLDQIEGKIDDIVRNLAKNIQISADTNQKLEEFIRGTYERNLKSSILVATEAADNVTTSYKKLYLPGQIISAPGEPFFPFKDCQTTFGNPFCSNVEDKMLTKVNNMTKEKLGVDKFLYTVTFLGGRNISKNMAERSGQSEIQQLETMFDRSLEADRWSQVANDFAKIYNMVDDRTMDYGANVTSLAFVRAALSLKMVNSITALYKLQIFQLEFMYKNPKYFYQMQKNNGKLEPQVVLNLPFSNHFTEYVNTVATNGEDLTLASQYLDKDILSARRWFFGYLQTRVTEIFGGRQIAVANNEYQFTDTGDPSYSREEIAGVIKPIKYVPFINNALKKGGYNDTLLDGWQGSMENCTPDSVSFPRPAGETDSNETYRSTTLKFTCVTSNGQKVPVTIPLLYQLKNGEYSQIPVARLHFNYYHDNKVYVQWFDKNVFLKTKTSSHPAPNTVDLQFLPTLSGYSIELNPEVACIKLEQGAYWSAINYGNVKYQEYIGRSCPSEFDHTVRENVLPGFKRPAYETARDFTYWLVNGVSGGGLAYSFYSRQRLIFPWNSVPVTVWSRVRVQPNSNWNFEFELYRGLALSDEPLFKGPEFNV